MRQLILAGCGASFMAAAYLAVSAPAPVPVTDRGSAAAEIEPQATGSIVPPPIPATPSGRPPVLPIETAPLPAPVEPAPDLVARPVRDVTPAGVTPGPKVTGPLVRIAPVPVPEKPKPAAEPPPQPQGTQARILRPTVPFAGLIAEGQRTIRLGGVAPTEVDLTCGPDGWPCGPMARAAARGLLRGRSVLCDLPPGETELPDPALCRVGGYDIGEWLVAQGWAKADGPVYREAEDRARTAKLGLWSETRPGPELPNFTVPNLGLAARDATLLATPAPLGDAGALPLDLARLAPPAPVDPAGVQAAAPDASLPSAAAISERVSPIP